MTEGARRALVVACDTYADSKLRKLPATSADADAMARALGNPEIGGFEVEVSKNEEERIVRRRLTAFFRDRGRDDLLVLHLSCHGLKDDEGNLHFATTDTEVDDLEATSIASDFVNRQMARSLSRRIVLLLDCCYSGAFAGGMLSKAGDTLDLKERFDGRGRVVLTASTSMEFAWVENELTGSSNPSIFTSALVHGLETGCADRNRDGWITVEELYDYAYERVRQVTPKQTPGQWTFDLQGELYLARSSLVPELPPELQSAVDSPYSNIRLGAVEQLARLARGSEARSATAAREALEMLRLDDSKSVSEAASAALVEPPPWTEAPLDTPRPAPIEPDPPDRPERIPSWVWLLGAAATLLLALGLAFPWDVRGRSWVDRQFLAVGWIADWLSALSPFALIVGAIAGLVLAYRPATRAFGAGALIGLGLVAAGKYGGLVLWLTTLTEMRRAASLIVLTLVVAAGCALVGLGVWLARRAPSEASFSGRVSRLVVGLVVAGSALTLLGCVIPFNGGSEASAIDPRAIVPGVKNEADSWLALDLAFVVLAALGALIVARHSRAIASGILVAVGVVSGLLWIRYIGIPIAQKNTQGSAAPGGFVGLAGALAFTCAGVLLTRPERHRASAPERALEPASSA